jgi:hypothetical protein
VAFGLLHPTSHTGRPSSQIIVCPSLFQVEPLTTYHLLAAVAQNAALGADGNWTATQWRRRITLCF